MYCGICYNDSGLLRKLLGPYLTKKIHPVTKKLVEIYWCSFCQAEREPMQAKVRVVLMPFKQVSEPKLHMIPLVVTRYGGPV